MTQKGNLNKGHQSPESECHQRRRLCVGVRAQKQIRLLVFSAATSFCSKSFCFQKLKTQTKIKHKNSKITLTNVVIIRAFLCFLSKSKIAMEKPQRSRHSPAIAAARDHCSFKRLQNKVSVFHVALRGLSALHHCKCSGESCYKQHRSALSLTSIATFLFIMFT